MGKPTDFLREEYEELVKQNFDWKLRELKGPSAPHSIVAGKEVLMLCSNNYLNLSNHPKIKQAAKDAIDTHGAGSGSVRPIAGNMDLHIELEKAIAQFKGSDAAIVYQTGFAANAGLIPQLVGKKDLIISDELNHGSIIDGVRLTKASRAVYAHCNMEELEKLLKETKGKHRRTLLITDGVFSMDGDIAPMDRIVELAEEHDAMTYVDDAHGEGVLGEKGKGISSHYKIEGRVDFEIGTFSKAFGVVGGYAAGSQDMYNFALNKSRTYLLSGSHPPAVAAACKAAVEVLENEPEHVEKLWKNTKYFKKELKSFGYDTGISETPIIPVIVGESSKAKELSEALFDEGIFALPIVFPMVARDKARIRVMMNSGLEQSDLDFSLAMFEKCGHELGII